MLACPVAARSWACVLLLGVVLTQTSCTSHPSKSSGPPSVVPFTAAAAASLSAGLQSGDESQVLKVVALPSSQPLSAAVVSQLATLKVTIDPATFLLADNGTGTAKANVGGAVWDVAFILVDGVWKISATVPVAR